MSAEANKALVRRFFDELCNGRNAAVADEILSADFVYHDPQVPSAPGPKGMADVVKVYQDGVEGHWEVNEIQAAENDRVVARWTGSGTHSGDLMGIPPSGRKVEVAAISLFEISGGKITANWTVWDTLTFMRQIGVIPEPAAAAAS